MSWAAGRRANYADVIAKRLIHYFNDPELTETSFSPLFMAMTTPQKGPNLAALIEARLDKVYDAAIRTAPHLPGVTSWIGWWFRAHVEAYLAAESNPEFTMTMLYRNNLAPEQYGGRGQLFDINVLLFETELRLAWRLPVKPNCKPDNLALKLLLKGSPTTASYRYGKGQVEKCASAGGLARELVRCICLSHKLCLYEFDTALVRFSEHIRLTKMELSDLVTETCNETSSRGLYNIITRFVVGATKIITHLYATVQTVDMFKRHIDIVSSGKAISPIKQPQDPTLFWAALIKAIRLKHKVPGWVQDELGAATIASMSDAFDNIEITSPKLRQDILVNAGISDRAIALLNKASQEAIMPSAKAMRALMCDLPARDRAILYIAVLKSEHQRAVPRRHYLGNAVHAYQAAKCYELTGSSTYTAAVCASCYLWRSNVKREKTRHDNPERARHGIAIDHDDNVPRCRNCWSDRIHIVDMIGARVTAYVRCSPGATLRTITLCSSCMVATFNPQLIGVHFYCTGCAQKHSRSNLGVCICGVVNSGPASSMINESGEISEYRWCSAHAHLQPDTCVQLTDKPMKQFASFTKR
jgi:hypothetical protein